MATDVLEADRARTRPATGEPPAWPVGRWLLIAAVLGWFAPADPGADAWPWCAGHYRRLAAVLRDAGHARGVRAFGLTLGITALATVVNTVFGIAFALVLVRQRFWGRALAGRRGGLAVRRLADGGRLDADRALRARRLAGPLARAAGIPGRLRRARA